MFDFIGISIKIKEASPFNLFYIEMEPVPNLHTRVYKIK